MSGIWHPDFRTFMEDVVLPRYAVYPDHERLDGKLSGGNRASAGGFFHRGRSWTVHEDTHYDRLIAAYEAVLMGSDPFVEQPTAFGMSLDLRAELKAGLHTPSRKYLYIYER
jgi:hypothetical protein